MSRLSDTIVITYDSVAFLPVFFDLFIHLSKNTRNERTADVCIDRVTVTQLVPLLQHSILVTHTDIPICNVNMQYTLHIYIF